MTETIRVTEDMVSLRSDRPKHIGARIDVEVKLPEGVFLESFTLNGTITSCEYVSNLPATRLPTPETAFSLCAGTSGNGGQVATHAGIEASSCTWRWQAGGGQVATGASIEAARCARHWQAGNGLGSYILEMKIGDISPINTKILKAYIDFLGREDMLKGIKIDLKALQEVFSHFGERLNQLRATSELTRSKLEGVLELLMRNSGKKITIH